KTGSTTNCQTIGMSLTAQTKVLYGNFVLQTGSHTNQHTRCLCGFDEENMNIVAEKLFEAKSNTAGSTAYTAGNVNKQRMVCVYSNTFFCKLFLDTFCGNSIAKEQSYRVFVVY